MLILVPDPPARKYFYNIFAVHESLKSKQNNNFGLQQFIHEVNCIDIDSLCDFFNFQTEKF